MKKISVIFLICSLFALPGFAQKSGKKAYEISCQNCHGANGAGGKDHLQGPNLTILKKEYFMQQFKAILDGKRKGPGTVNMLKTLKDSKLTDKEIMAAAEYAVKLPEARPNHKKFGDAKKGKDKYVACLHCHGDKAQGYTNPGLPAPRLVGQSDFYIVDMLKSFKAGHRGNDTPGGMQMKAMSMTLATEEDMKNVAAYIRSFEPKPAKKQIHDLTYKVYQGKWKKLPDFSKIKHVKDGMLNGGIIDIKASEMKNNFAMVFEGSLKITKDDQYSFFLSSDDGAEMFINGKKIISNDGLHPPSKVHVKNLKLKKGSVPIKVTYFDGGGGTALNISWRQGKKGRSVGLSTTGGGKKGSSNIPPIVLKPQDGEAIVLRNFMNNTQARGIAVGYPEKTHVLYNAANMSLAAFWKNEFVDAGAMWNNRGTKHIFTGTTTAKVGNDIQFALLPNAESAWPLDQNRDNSKRRVGLLRFKGYKLDAKRYPTFMYTLNEISFDDFLKPIDSNGTGVVREIAISSPQDRKDLWFRIAAGNISQSGDLFNIEGQYKVKAAGAKIRQYGKIKELMLPVQFSGGKASVKVTYLFNEAGLGVE